MQSAPKRNTLLSLMRGFTVGRCAEALVGRLDIIREDHPQHYHPIVSALAAVAREPRIAYDAGRRLADLLPSLTALDQFAATLIVRDVSQRLERVGEQRGSDDLIRRVPSELLASVTAFDESVSTLAGELRIAGRRVGFNIF